MFMPDNLKEIGLIAVIILAGLLRYRVFSRLRKRQEPLRPQPVDPGSYSFPLVFTPKKSYYLAVAVVGLVMGGTLIVIGLPTNSPLLIGLIGTAAIVGGIYVALAAVREQIVLTEEELIIQSVYKKRIVRLSVIREIDPMQGMSLRLLDGSKIRIDPFLKDFDVLHSLLYRLAA